MMASDTFFLHLKIMNWIENIIILFLDCVVDQLEWVHKLESAKSLENICWGNLQFLSTTKKNHKTNEVNPQS